MRHRTLWEWLLVVLIGLVVFAAVLAPAYVVREQHQDTERIIAQLDRSAERRLDDAIRVNVHTIACLLLIEPPDRNVRNMTACVNEGLNQPTSSIPEPDA